MRRIESVSDVEAGLGALIAVDPRLASIAAVAGPLPLRLRAGGFEGLAAIVTGQQISTSAADSIWARLAAAVAPFSPERFLCTSDEALRLAGLSRSKIDTLRSMASACVHGFDFSGMHDAPAEQAMAALTANKGIGAWTAEIYLLFCAGHPDIFPAGDLALQNAVQQGLGLDGRPAEKALRLMAEAWSPWRSVAARLFWAYYRARRDATKSALSAEREAATSLIAPGTHRRTR